MSIITNQAKRIDILHVHSVANIFTFKIFNTNTETYLFLDSNNIELILKDARNNNIGNPFIDIIDNDTGQINVFDIVPPGYSGSIKYVINYITGSDTLQLLKGNIDCVDTTHIPAGTSKYVTHGNVINISSAIGTTNNITVEIAIGLAGPTGATGPAGPQGAAGPQGPTGNTGPAGAAGATGPQGPTGATGPQGADGKTIRHGAGAPTLDTGVNGDFYINTSANTIYGPKTAGAWGSPTSLVGPPGVQGNTGATGPAGPQGAAGSQGPIGNTGPAGPTGATGPQGPTGATGPQGADGKTVLSGAGAPSGGLGVNGDFYINTSASTIYGPKTAGAWGSPTSLIGPTGSGGDDAIIFAIAL